MRSVREQLRNARVRVSLPFISYEMSVADLVNPTTVDERIEGLNRVRADLLGAVEAVEKLQSEAQQRKQEVAQLEQTMQTLKQDRHAVETLLKVPEESFARLIARASSKARTRGILEGIIIGLVTGTLSSFLVWYLTK